ncbi:MAG: hypothetical protein R3242_00745 [Akkermansiaceae bacterium]|nr:hypothetical protein [Akkermansiaceae bacterium]
MKPIIPLFCCTPLLLVPIQAQEKASEPDPVEAAIETFNNRDRSNPIEPFSTTREQATQVPVTPEEAGPVLVTGKRPENRDLIDISEIPIDPEVAGELPPADFSEPKGLRLRVERMEAGKGELEPKNISLVAPFPAKPLDEAPKGWRLETSSTAPALRRQVELAPGKSITLTIRPHVLVPDADQDQVLSVAEPGFEASLGYQQSDTVAAVLSDSIRKLDEDSRQIGRAIDQLQQLIVSLPKPESPSNIPDAQNPIPEQP